MRFLIDNSMSPRFAAWLRDAGHEAVHVRDESLTSAADIVIFGKAESDGSTLLAQDTDFGTILALRKATKPSVVLFRCHAKSTERSRSCFWRICLRFKATLKQGPSL